jgi:manganese/zinc/iron transport system substrate-binding protein
MNCKNETYTTKSSLPGRVTLLLLAALLLLLAGCNPAGQAAANADGKIRVVTTIGMITDVARNVGGEHVEVTGLMRAGVDPHLYKATEGDVNKLLNAQIIFYGGLFLEARMEDVFEQMAESKPTVAVGEAVPVAERLASPQYAEHFDPHIWMDVKNWMLVVEKIRDELIAFDPDNEASYRANTDAYLAEMKALESWVHEQVATVPEEQRLLVTAHDAFHYFAKGYNFEVFAPQGISTESEAGVEDIRRTIDLVVERNIPAIFVESSVPPDVVEAIVEGARARGHDIHIGGSLFSDAMGEEGTPEGTYIGMIRHNVQTVTSALRGE